MSSTDNAPVEILGCIFYSVVAPQRLDCTQCWSLPYKTITRFRLVCRRWNQIILSDSQFWSDIAIRVNWYDDPYFPHEPPFEVLQAWIDRSGGALLNIKLGLPVCFSMTPRGTKDPSDHTRNESDAREYLWKIFPLLMSTSTQWRSLSVASTVDALTTIFSLLDQVPRLQTLNLEIYEHSRLDDLRDFKLFAPMLDKIPFLERFSLSVSAFRRTYDYVYPDIPPRTLSKITELHLCEFIHLPILLSVLRECLALRWADVSASFLEDATLPVQRFQLPYLETLIVSLCCNIQQFFDSLELPNLSVLELGATYQERGTSTTALSQFSPRVSHPLQIFIWSGLRLAMLEALLLCDDTRLFAIPVFHASLLGEAAPEEAEAATEKAQATLAHLFPNKEFAFSKESFFFGWVDWDVYRQWEHVLPHHTRNNVIECFQ